MSFRRTFVSGALAVVAMCIALPVSAQFGRGGGSYTPDPGATDLKATLFNWAWHMGMLRSEAESELILTLEYRGVGTIQVNGQTCTLAAYVDAEPGELGTSGYRISANYRLPGYRVPIECTLPDGQTYSNVETLSGEYAWDEDIPGAEIVPGEGTATPRPASYDERLIRLWASPHGAPKAAIAAAAGLPTSESFAQNPATLLDRQAAAGVESMTTLQWQGNRATLTFPIPGVAGAIATAMLNEEFLPESVVVKRGNDTTEFIYSDFADFNNPYHRIEAMYAGRIIERHNGAVVRDLRTVVTEIGQGYVVVPVPDSVRAAGPARNR
jgi:hypothetical protein